MKNFNEKNKLEVGSVFFSKYGEKYEVVRVTQMYAFSECGTKFQREINYFGQIKEVNGYDSTYYMTSEKFEKIQEEKRKEKAEIKDFLLNVDYEKMHLDFLKYLKETIEKNK